MNGELYSQHIISFMIKIRWRVLNNDDSAWSHTRCLYAYLTPNGKEILYIGEAWGTTVRERWSRSRKEEFWKDLEKNRGIKHHIVLIGEIFLPLEQRLTQELLKDIESLLINEEKPWGNIQCQHTRIQRPGMVVKCSGVWPGERNYIDRRR